MRTTLSLDPDVAARLRTVMKNGKVTLKRAINDALRRGLAGASHSPRIPRFKLKSHACGGFQPGVDPAKLGQLLDDLESEEFLRKARR